MQALVNEYLVGDEAQRLQASKSLAEATKEGRLVQLVGLLGDQLTQANHDVRTLATGCLGDTIRHSGPLGRSQMQVLVTFFLERLDDDATLPAVIGGLRALVRNKNFTGVLASEVLTRLNKLEIRGLRQPERHAVYELLRELAAYGHPEFVKTFSDLSAGEKDPQNLLLTLAVAREVLQRYELDEKQREDIFDITFCYFPVTFRPPKDMPYHVTTDELKARLRATISQPALASLVIPALLSKLAAVSIEVKLDVLDALYELVGALDQADLIKHWHEVWDGLKYEILHGSPENETYDATLKVLGRLSAVEDSVRAAIEEEYEKLKNPKLGPEVCRLIVGVCGDDNEGLFKSLATSALDIILLPSDDEHNNDKVPLLNILLEAPYPVPKPDEILSALLSAANSNTDASAPAVHGLALLAIKNQFYTPLVVQTITAKLADKRTHDEAIAALRYLAKSDSASIIQNCLSTLLSELPSNYSPAAERDLQVLARVCITKDLLHALTIRLLSFLDKLTEVDYVYAVIAALVGAASSMKDAELAGFQRLCLPLQEKLVTARDKPQFNADRVVDKACELVELAGRVVPKAIQAAHGRTVGSLFERAQVFSSPLTNIFSLFVSSIVVFESFPGPSNPDFKDLAHTLQQSRSVFVRTGYLRFVALAVNKWPGLLKIPQYCEWLRERVERGTDVANSLELLVWLAKGLVLRADRMGFELVTSLTESLGGPLGSSIARVFGVLVANDRVLCSKNNVTVRRLYKQRLFVQTLPALLAGCETESKANYLTALSALLRYTPGTVVSEHLDKILPVLTQNLALSLPPVQYAAVNTIVSALPDASAAVSEHLPVFVPQMLQLATDPDASPAVRGIAVEALTKFADVFGGELRDYAPVVITGLVPVLNDKRREVRRNAVRCRQKYFSI